MVDKYHCPECGGENVNLRCYANLNTAEIVDWDWDDEPYCEDCNCETYWCTDTNIFPECKWEGHKHESDTQSEPSGETS